MQDSPTLKHHHQLINGDWTDSASGETITIENPGRRTPFATVPRSGAEDVDKAVNAARKAFPGWRAMPARERGKLLLKVAETLQSQIEELATTVATETGNAIRTQARPEATLTADTFRYFGGLASELKGETIPLGDHNLNYSVREPIGVVAAVIPWNAPVMLGAMKIAPALAAGNTMVLKAAEDAPLGILLVARACAEHLPPGVLNVLTGYGPECGGPLSEHPAIRKLSFTGSTAVGKQIMKVASERIVPVSLELGGKSPSIVYPDANEDWAVEGMINAMRFSRQGQSCTAGSRLFLHADIYDSFLEKLVEKTSALKIGDPLDEATDMGSIINNKQFTRVCGFIEEGLASSDADLVTGGMPPEDGPLSEGYFVQPTIFGNATNDWRLAREEIFGPVLVAIKWTDEEEAIRMANDSHYGLAAFVWSRDMARAITTANRIEAGWVQVNQGGGQVLGMSYGGIKESGIGREFSLEGMIDSFTQKKSINVNLDLPPPK